MRMHATPVPAPSAATPAPRGVLRPVPTDDAAAATAPAHGHDFAELRVHADAVPPQLVQRAPDDSTPAAPLEAAEGDLAGDADTEVRRQLVGGMNAFMDAIVGDPVYEAAMKEVTWNEHKGREALAMFKRFIQELESGKKQPPVAITTTCIAVQQALITRLTGVELRLGRFQKALGPTAKLVGEGLGPGVWNEAQPNMAARPRRGDIYVLEFQNAKVVQLVQYLASLQVEEQLADQKGERLQGQRAQLQAQVDAYDPATAPKGTPKPQTWRLGNLDAQLAKLKEQQAELDQRFASVATKLQGARSTAADERERMAHHPLRQKKKLPDFEFSHVGFVVSIEKLPAADARLGAGTQQERWLTFDGGQRVQARGGKEGATLVPRIYHPETNEITGEAQQRMGPRLLKGWIDVDKLVAAQQEATP